MHPHPIPSPDWADFTIMMECTPEVVAIATLCVLCGEGPLPPPALTSCCSFNSVLRLKRDAARGWGGGSNTLEGGYKDTQWAQGHSGQLVYNFFQVKNNWTVE